MPNYGMMLKSWLKIRTPRVIMARQDSVIIIHSIVPYESRKRTRDADA